MLLLEGIAVLVLFELGLRVVYGAGLGLRRTLYMSGSRTKYSHVETLPELLALTPNGFVPFREDGDFVNNSRSLRTTEYERAKEAGTYRVLVFGDSFTYSSGGIPYRRMWHSRLAEELEHETGRDVEVLSFGVPATGPDFALRLWDLEGSGLDADLVVLAFYVGNDFTDVGGYLADEAWMDFLARRVYTIRLARNLHLMSKLKRSSPRTGPTVVRSSGGFALETQLGTQETREDTVGRTLPEDVHHELTLARMVVGDVRRTVGFDRALQRVRDILTGFDRGVRARGGRFVVMAIPDEYQVDRQLRSRALERGGEDEAGYDIDRPQRRLARVCDELGIPFVDLLPASRARAESGALYLPRDTHWNARGNRMAAEELASDLLERGIVGS